MDCTNVLVIEIISGQILDKLLSRSNSMYDGMVLEMNQRCSQNFGPKVI